MKKIAVTAVILALLLSFCLAFSALAATPTKGDGWPPAGVLAEFGLEGMPLPTGASEVWWRNAQPDEARSLPGAGILHLLIGLQGTDATGGSLKGWFEDNGWVLMRTENTVFSYNKGAAVAVFDFSGGTGQIKAGVYKGTWPDNAVWERFGLGGLTMPSGVAITEISDSGNEVNIFTIGGNNTAYAHLRDQFVAKMGQPGESEGQDGDTIRQDAFWNPKTNVAVYLGREGVMLDFSVIQQ